MTGIDSYNPTELFILVGIGFSLLGIGLNSFSLSCLIFLRMNKNHSISDIDELQQNVYHIKAVVDRLAKFVEENI